jgi:hypothetical protein
MQTFRRCTKQLKSSSFSTTCVEYGDKPEDIWGYDPKDDFDDEEVEDLENGDGMILDGGEGIPAIETDAWLKRQGRAK